jgi:endo-1,4-beta-xylanase
MIQFIPASVRNAFAPVLTGIVLLAACGNPTPKTEPATGELPALQTVFDSAFLIGAALNPEQFHERDVQGAALVRKHFNTITPENVMKWEKIHPEPDQYSFEEADRFVEFGEANSMFIVGHTLVWHSQTPDWVFEDASGKPLDREGLLERMQEHISAVVGRYKGRVHGWDVVNEALEEDGTLRMSKWRQIIGDDYLANAFEYAHAADPDAELYYNDYSLENAPKRGGAVKLVSGLLDAGLTVTGIGTQGHSNLEWPAPDLFDATIQAFSELGVTVMVTELDIDVLPRANRGQSADVGLTADFAASLNPYETALPDSIQSALADRYAELFEVFLKHRDALSRVTFWGVTDGDSWLNGWPVRGRSNYPLLFDREYKTKPAFDAVIETATAL